MKTDTIAAVATAMSDSGIGIIRVSGEESIKIVDKIYRNKKNQRSLTTYDSHTIHYGFIVEDGRIIDEIMVSVMKAPRSYTTEDTVEINCHGGILLMQKILSLVIKAGARIAEPGEFTKRAFLNGRIDLSKAEAVMDIINAKNEFALASSVKQLKGSVSDKIKEIRDSVLYEIAFIESSLDDPEHISLDGYRDRLYGKTEGILKELNQLLDSADEGKILKEGINTVIVGKPNAGKSSLLNVLAGEEKAIVTEVAGTTRDMLEETISLSGITFNIKDTAGIRNTEDIVEKIGVERAKKTVNDADLVLYVIDSSLPFDENDMEIMKMIQNKKTVILFNKSDLREVVEEKIFAKKMENVIGSPVSIKECGEGIFEYSIEKKEKDYVINSIRTSTKEKYGIDELLSLIKNMFFHGKISYNDEVYITNMRHKEALTEAKDSLLQVENSIKTDMPEDFYSIDLMSAYASLGKIIGEEVGEDLINEIFSKFCMGK